MLLQKYYSKDHLCKKTIRNNGVLPKFYVEGTHPAIISKADFDEVQRIFESRNTVGGNKRLNDYDFKGMVFCGCCGWSYLRKKNYKKHVWKCGKANSNGKEFCSGKQIPDDILHELAVVFDKKIEKIIILSENNVKFIFTDKSEIIKHWVQPSRAESWTSEMKSEAAKISKERRWHNADSNKN